MQHPEAPIPTRFTGLSYEVTALRERWLDRTTGGGATLVRQLDPPSLRFSANAADQSYWTRDPTEHPLLGLRDRRGRIWARR